MKLPPEVECGNIEYKLKINPEQDYRLIQLSTQLRWRCREGNGLAIYFLGVSDSGNIVGLANSELESSLLNLQKIVDLNGYQIIQKNVNPLVSGTFWASVIITGQVKAMVSNLFNN